MYIPKEIYKSLDDFINSISNKNISLIEILHYAQNLLGFLPIEIQNYIAKKLNIPVEDIYDIVQFYSYFKTKVTGKYKISVCLGSMCLKKGANDILLEFEKELGIKSGETTSDLMFTLEGVRCIGACGISPVVVVNEKVFGKVDINQVKEIISNYKNK